jgi:hypothetical protein
MADFSDTYPLSVKGANFDYLLRPATGKAPTYYWSQIQLRKQPAFPWTTAKATTPYYDIASMPSLVSLDTPADFPASPIGLDLVEPFAYLQLSNQSGQQFLQAVQMLLLSKIKERAKIADRLTALYRDAEAEGENILGDSISQFSRFFLAQSDLTLPKITLTPDGTLRIRWIQSKEHFIAIEFTGKPLVKYVAEIPRTGGSTARYFASEPLEDVVRVARAIGAWIA